MSCFGFVNIFVGLLNDEKLRNRDQHLSLVSHAMDA
jgi:hypothetical protein